ARPDGTRVFANVGRWDAAGLTRLAVVTAAASLVAGVVAAGTWRRRTAERSARDELDELDRELLDGLEIEVHAEAGAVRDRQDTALGQPQRRGDVAGDVPVAGGEVAGQPDAR